MKGHLKTCPKGHTYQKSSDCPVCPICEKERKSEVEFLNSLAAPARRALENAGISSLLALSKRSEKEILALHGMGASSIPKLQKALALQGLSFKK